MRAQSGFTLMEVIIVIALIATVSVITIPNIVGMMPDYRLKSAAHDLFSNFQKAKLEAVKRNINTAIRFTASGYTVFVDSAQDFKYDGGEDVVAAVKWSDYTDVSVNLANFSFDTGSGQSCIAFRPDGIPTDAGGGVAGGTAQLDNTKGKSTRVIISQAGNIRID